MQQPQHQGKNQAQRDNDTTNHAYIGKRMLNSLVLLIVFTICSLDVRAFSISQLQHKSCAHSCISKSIQYVKPLHSTNQDDTDAGERSPRSKRKDEEVSRFLTDFKTAQGNLVDPYKVLKIRRSASSLEIKQSYRKLSRKWHPDAVARKEILPGKWWVRFDW